MSLTPYLLVTAVVILTTVIVAWMHWQRATSLGRATAWQPVDVRAMARLFDKGDDEFIAARVSIHVLLQLRIQRALAATEYLSRLRANTRYAIAVAKLNPGGADLLETATALRLEVAKLQGKAWLGVIAPVNADFERLSSLMRVFANRSSFAAVPIR